MGFSFDPREPSKTKILKKLPSYLKTKLFLMTDHIIRNNLRKKELVVIESKQKLQSFCITPPPFHFPAFNVIFLFKEKCLWITILGFKMFLLCPKYMC